MHLKRLPDDKTATAFFQHDYQDRGMLKWGGFYLSDHTSALAKMHAAEQIEAPLPEQDIAEVSQKLARAWHAKRSVHLQLNVMDDDQVLKLVDGIVCGINDDRIILRLASGRYRRLQLGEIRCVQSSSLGLKR